MAGGADINIQRARLALANALVHRAALAPLTEAEVDAMVRAGGSVYYFDQSGDKVYEFHRHALFPTKSAPSFFRTRAEALECEAQRRADRAALDYCDLLGRIEKVRKGFVLVVDDAEDARNWMLTVLEGHGYQAQAATTGTEAALAPWRAETPALVVVDLFMPGRTGDMVIQTVRDWWPGAAILMSSSVPVGGLELAHQNQVPFWPKGGAADSFAAAVKAAIDNKRKGNGS